MPLLTVDKLMARWFPLNQHSVPVIAMAALLGCGCAVGEARAPLFFLIAVFLIFTGGWFFKPYALLRNFQWFLLIALLFSGYTHHMLVKKQRVWQQVETSETERLISGVIQDRVCAHGRCVWTLLANQSTFTLNTPRSNCQIGDTLSAMAKLKKPHGHHNPGGSNQEQAAFLKGMMGYATLKTAPTCVATAHPTLKHTVLRWREATANWQAKQLPKDTVGIVQALTLGLKKQIDQDQWQTFRITGTSHLMAISGLHIGLMFLFAFSCSRLVFARIPQVLQRVPLSIVAGWLSFMIALGYAVISGWEIPAQRATAMLLCMMLTTTLRLPRPAWLGFWLALLVVLASNPLSLLSPGFWLSFGAVAFLIVLGMGGHAKTSQWKIMLRCQLLLSIALIPLSTAWFGGFSVISPLANFIAIPWVSFGIVPLALIATIMMPLAAELAQYLLLLAAWQTQGLMALLQFLADFHWSYFVHPASVLGITLALLGALWVTLPKSIPYKPLAGLLWLPFFLQSPHPAPTIGARVMLLDVGQGLAMVIQTPHHAILYDTGPKTPYSDAGKDIVLPALRYYGIKYLDHIVVSHGDMDHRGGLPAIREAMPYGRLLTSNFEVGDSQPCVTGERWSYDEVQFEVLHPDSTAMQKKKNNYSCVILVTIGSHRILLTGDIEKSVEEALLTQLTDIDVLIVPHHGSKTSSSEAFLTTLQPKQAWIPVGWHNRYHHPHPSTVARYEVHGIPLWRTDESGALMIEIAPHQPLAQPIRWRDTRWWWAPMQ